MNRDSIGNTFFVAITLCLACSALVSLAAVGLKPLQSRNKALDKKKNILTVAGLYEADQRANVDEVFSSMIVDRVVDLESGNDVTSEYPGGAGTFDPEALIQEPGHYLNLDPKKDKAVLKSRELRAHVYLVKASPTDASPQMYIFPIRGKGLWSTLKGFIALDVDLRTVRGLTFYEHAETPGLGGEVDNPEWKAKWPGKIALNEGGDVVIRVVKNSAGDHAVDALSGATITSNGVQSMLDYWLGPDGFGPYIQSLTRNTGTTPMPKGAAQGDSHG